MHSISNRDWFDLDYLRTGSARQQAAYDTIIKLNLFAILADYHPVLAGTLPLELDVAHSDLDILSEVYDQEAFLQKVKEFFGNLSGFQIHQKEINRVSSVVVRFRGADFPIEIFGQPRPVREQRAFRHMLVEARLLQLCGASLREAVLRRKKRGTKTEPAFAQALGLPGDPFRALLDLENLSDHELLRTLSRFQAKSLEPVEPRETG